MRDDDQTDVTGFTRRSFMTTSAGVAGGLLMPSFFSNAFAADSEHSPLGNYPRGVEGDTVFMGIAVPLTGPYSAEGADEKNGYALAIEQLNNGDSRIKKISPKTKKGVLGKKVVYDVADNETDPNTAVQAHTRFIRENKAMMITGCVSSAVAIASEKLAQREKTIYLACVSGSNDTTGKDCQRYGFRSCMFAYNSSKAQAPFLAKALGKKRKAIYLVPDYTYGHTVYDSMTEFTEKEGWTTVGEQLAPLGTSDFSSYLLNIANSDADVLVNIAFGADAANSTKQAKQFGILDKMDYVVPYMSPFLAQEVGADIMQGVYGCQDFWWTQAEDNEVAKDFVDAFEEKHGSKPRWSAASAYMQTALWADAVERAGTWYPPAVVKAYEDESVMIDTIWGKAHWRACDHQLVRSIPVLKGKKPDDMRNEDDFFEVVGMSGSDEIMPPCDHFGCKLGSYT